MLRSRIVINGECISLDEEFDVIDPATGAVIGRAPDASAEHADAAIAAARTAFPAWSRTSDAERKTAIHAAADAVAANADELAQILTQEQGKPLNGLGSRFELGAVDAWARFTADLELPVELIKDDNEGRIERHRKPIGVLGSITPWNWPMMILCWHVVPALRAGNTVVARPSPNTPLAALRMIELMAGALPPGVLNGFSSSEIIAARRLTQHPDVSKLIFTGSSPTGARIMANASETLKRLTLELGGNDAGIVLPDADPAAIAEGLFWGAFINSGQTCAALKRLYVHDDIYDAVCEALVAVANSVPVGNGLDESSILGPVQNAGQRQIVDGMVREAVSSGARLLLGGEMPDGPGFFYPTTLVAEARQGMRLVDEEQFGPALPIIRYTDIDAVISESNKNPNGLGGSVWTSDREAARDIALRMECGTVWWNQHGAVNPAAPFGGSKGSGFGVQFGVEGLKECTVGQTLFL